MAVSKPDHHTPVLSIRRLWRLQTPHIHSNSHPLQHAQPRPIRSRRLQKSACPIRNHMTVPDILGICGTVLSMSVWFPQLRTVWVTREHQGVNLHTYVLIMMALITWASYGVLMNAWMLVCSNAWSLVLCVTIWWRVKWLRRVDQVTSR